MTGTLSAGLIALSTAVALLTADIALALVWRAATGTEPSERRPWLAGAAVVLGVGVWSAHFIEMFGLGMLIPAGVSIGTALLSLSAAVAIGGMALWAAAGGDSIRRTLAAGALAGFAIVAAFAIGMDSLLIHPGIMYSPWGTTAAAAMAVGGAAAALYLDLGPAGWRRAAAAAAMGLAIAGTPYVTMVSALVPPAAADGRGDGLIAVLVAGLTSGVLSGTFIMSLLHRRLEVRTSRLAESLRTANDQLMYVATHDALTGLPNRLLLIDRMQQAMHASRRGGRPFAVIYMDLDGFKPVNDSLGHAAGDVMLTAVSERLQGRLRRHDTLARVGGDEFVVLAEDLQHPDDAMDVCEGIVMAMRKPVDVSGTPLHVTVSMGIAIFPGDGFSVEALLRSADAAMYEVKKSGRNGYRYFEAAMNADALRTLRIQADLQLALAEGQLSLWYQPQLECRDRRLVGVEVLLRWEHPELGWIGPGEFIPIAERSGLILEVGAWVVQEACRRQAQWQAQGLAPVSMAINLSPRQLRQRNLAEHVYTAARSFGVDPATLMLEITETAAMEEAEANVEAVQALQRRGFGIAIDDFGRGYSSLSYLQRFRVGQIKIDACFVAALDEPEGAAVVAAVIAMAHALHMEVVAEGVETESQWSQLQDLGCDIVQGYRPGRPMPEAEFTALLCEGRAVRTRALPVLQPECS